MKIGPWRTGWPTATSGAAAPWPGLSFSPEFMEERARGHYSMHLEHGKIEGRSTNSPRCLFLAERPRDEWLARWGGAQRSCSVRQR